METDKKKLELWDCNQSQNILRDLMRRDFGLLYYNSCKTNTRNLEVAAEKKLTAKRYNELVIILSLRRTEHGSKRLR